MVAIATLYAATHIEVITSVCARPVRRVAVPLRDFVALTLVYAIIHASGYTVVRDMRFEL
jgi:hypothetical protein